MKAIDIAGDKWAELYGSEVLEVFYEDCRTVTTTCFRRIFDFLQVDPSHLTKEKQRFESAFAAVENDLSLDQVINRGPVLEALGVNGYAKYIGMEKNYTEIQLLVYDETQTLEKTHQFHQGKGINVTLFGRAQFESKFAAALPLLSDMAPETLVILSDSLEVRLRYPPGNDYLRYDSIYAFRIAFDNLTRNYPGAVVASTESSCCASALTHASPGDFFSTDGTRKLRSCLSGQPGCEWAGDEKSWPWQTFMQELAFGRSTTVTDHQYLDATLLAGKAADLIKFIKAVDIGEDEDDEAVLTDFMYRKPHLLVLDYEQRLFGKNREGLHKHTNSGCPFGPPKVKTARQLELAHKTLAMFMHAPRDLGCVGSVKTSKKEVFPRWDKGGILIRPILDHLERVADEKASIVLPLPVGRVDYRQGPEIPYFVDERGVWTSKLIRDRTDATTMQWRVVPTEGLIHMAHQLLKLKGGDAAFRWSALLRTVKSGGFPYWGWYGDFKYCNFHNYGTESIPLFTTCARADCDHGE
jgi:hypothetical protein